MSDRKRDKTSKSTYMREARKQRMIENQFMHEVEKAQEAAQPKHGKWQRDKPSKRMQWDDEE